MSRVGCWCLSLPAALLAAPPALAGPPEERWQVQVTPYVWAAALDARIRPAARLPTLRAALSFGDVLEDLDAGFFLHALARRDRLVLLADLSFVETSRNGSFDSLPALAGRASVTQRSATLAAGWRVLAGAGLDLDLLAGLRGWSIDSTAEIRLATAPFAGASATLSWVDPVLAARLRADLAPALSALVVADVGGFGLGARGTFQLAATLNLEVAEGVLLSAGYRHLAVDYREGGQRLDLALSGPLLGLTWRF